MKLQVGDIINVFGFIMLKGLNDSEKYRVSRVSMYGNNSVYWFTKPRGKKELIGHYTNDVDIWIGNNNKNLNRIDIISKC